ncbi:MAG: hypothetical protein A4E53_03823 [Pelotomaculum sp. PtaB.Bin104]|nr:MAG: hypothetical protein A4E53_03823 [Pelotomaculum sp. PtaB.Bin104]
MVEQMIFAAGEGRLRIELLVSVTEDGLVVQLFGGEKPHVGAVVLSLPRPGLNDLAKISCNTTIIPLLGHKDDEVAKPVAEEIAVKCGKPVVVVAGIHIEHAGPEEIKMLIKNCFSAVKLLTGSPTFAAIMPQCDIGI